MPPDMPEIAEAIEALSKEATQASPEPSSPEPSAPELETTRDTSGELAPVVPAKDSAPEPAKVEPALKAPASWKPEEREGWKNWMRVTSKRFCAVNGKLRTC